MQGEPTDATITPDQARARATIAAMTALVDMGDWDRLLRCFDDRLVLDYTSLWGGAPQEVTREDLVGQWRAMLPGFDATRHELGSVAVTVSGGEASAEAPVTGTHLLDGQAWIVEGRYRCHLRRHGQEWRITALTYLNETEQGDRALAERAQERASQGAS